MRRILLVTALTLLAPPAGAQDLSLATFDEAPGPLRPKLRAAMYEPSRLLGEKVLSPRVASDGRARLEALAAEHPDEAAVQRYLARALAASGEHRGAVGALRRAEELEGDEAWPLTDLAAYHGSRGNFRGQLGALDRLAKRRAAHLDRDGERTRLASEYRAMAELVGAHRIKGRDPLRYRRLAAELYPDRPRVASEVIDWLVGQGRLEDAIAQMSWARELRPADREDLAYREIELLGRLGRLDDARDVLERELPHDDGIGHSWIWNGYVSRLQSAERYEEALRRVRDALRGGPLQGLELAEAVHLLRLSGATEEAGAALDAALEGADSASDEELLVISALLCRMGRNEEGSRLLYAVAATSRSGGGRNRAQVRLARLLARGYGLATPSGVQALLEHRRLDPGPGVVGGGLSLLLGGPPGGPGGAVGRKLARYDRDHVRAARSLALVEDLRSRSRRGTEELAPLELELIETYRSYGATGTAYAASERFLERYPRHRRYFEVGLSTAELARAVRQDPMPLLRRLAREAVARRDDEAHRRVVQAIAAELTRERRFTQVVSTYWTAIEARPEDTRLYEGLLQFLGSHNMHDEEQRVYRRAITRFQDRGWPSRYARWLTRRRGVEAHQRLTRRLLGELGPSDLAAYLGETVSYSWREPDDDGSRFFLEVYREALRRHPGEPRFARRLLEFYGRNRIRFAAERRALLVQLAPYDGGMRNTLYVELATAGELDDAVEELAGGESAAARLLASDYLVRRAEHRRARATLAALVASQPGHRDLGLRLASLEVSLGGAVRGRRVIRALLGRLPTDRALLTRAGELAVEAGDLGGARRVWDRIPEARSGDPAAYLVAATLYWDYFMFDDAARTILAAREAMDDEDLYGFQLAAVHESGGDREAAVREYLRVLANAAGEAERWPPPWLRRPGGEGAAGRGGHDDGHRYGGADPVLQHVWDRLAALARRDGDRELVDRTLTAALSDRPDDPGLVHLRIDVLEATERWDDANGLLAREAMRLPSRSLQERAVARLTAVGMDDEATRILEQLAAARPEDLQPTYRLATHLERQGHVRQATATLTALAERLRADPERRRDLAGVEVRLSRMLYAHERFDEAITAARRGIDLLRGGRQRSLRITLARWLIRLERHEGAVETLAPVLDGSPDHAEALSVHTRALVALGLATGERREEVIGALRDSYDAAITAAREGAHDGDDARRRVRRLREAAIEHLVELRAPRAVLDQHVLLLNDDLENQQLVIRAYRHAAAHDLVDNLEGRYRRDSERSPRDHRLPLVLARLAAARGDLTAAGAEMERSLAVAPERGDLRQELVSYLLRRRAWSEAAEQYHQLAELDREQGLTGQQHTASEADMYGRLGQWERLSEAVTRMVEADGESSSNEHLVAAKIYGRHGRWPEAWVEGRAHLDFWVRADEDRVGSGSYGQPQLTEVATLAARCGRWGEARGVLRRLERSWQRTAKQRGIGNRYALERAATSAASARSTELARALAQHGVDGDIEGYVEALRGEVLDGSSLAELEPAARVGRQMALADLAGNVGSTSGQLELLELVASRNEGTLRTRVHRHMLKILSGVGAHRRAIELVRTADLEPRIRARALAHASASIGDRRGEIAALEALLGELEEPSFDHRGSELARLLELRWQQGDSGRRAVSALAAPGSGRSGQVINFLLEQGEHEAARQALERYAEGQRGIWVDMARARIMLHETNRSGVPAEAGPFVRVLDLRPIGARVDRPSRAGSVLTGSGWATLARQYGETLARDPSKAPAGVRHLDHAGIEAAPRSAEAHVHQGDQALGRGESQVAADHYRLARQLSPTSRSAWDGLARAHLAAGERDEALSLWDGLLSTCESEECIRGVLDSMVGAGLAAEGLQRVETHVERQWRTGRVSLALLRAMARVHGPRGQERDGPMDRLVQRLWQLDRNRMDLLRAAAGLDSPRLLLGRACGRYLREGLRRQTHSSHERAQWVQSYVSYLVEHEEHQALAELLDRYEAERHAASRTLPMAMLLARARAYLGLGRDEEAMETLRVVARERASGAVELLRELGREREAWTLQLEVAEGALARGEESRAVYLQATEALLELGRADEALTAARRGAAARPDDLPTLRATAELLAEHDQPEAALLLRRTVYEIQRSDYDNLLAMARLELTMGQVDVARRRALSLLARWAVPAAVEDGAADLLVHIVAEHRDQRGRATRALRQGLRERALDEDRALALARILDHVGQRRGARRLLERSVREASAPSRSLQLLARFEEEEEDHAGAERYLEEALLHGRGSIEVARQLFLVRRRMGEHQAALVVVGIASDRAAGVRMLGNLEEPQAASLCSQIADSAAELGWWAAADAYSNEALRRIDEEEEPERYRRERARLHSIRTHLATRSAVNRGRPWVTRGRG